MTRPRLFVTCRLLSDAIRRLADQFVIDYRDDTNPASPRELRERSRNVDALICHLVDPIDASFMQHCSSLKVVANVAVGFDNIDVEEATKRGILVLNTPGVLTGATADLTLGLLLSSARRIAEGDRYVRALKWTGWSCDLLLGHELAGKTLGIVGMGRIGEEVTRRARAFGMKIVYMRRGNDENEDRLYAEYSARRTSLNDLLAEADFVSLHCPLTKETRHLIGRAEFARMKSSSILINTARGAIIEQAALINALRVGQIAACALDVFDGEPEVPRELLDMDNVVLLPHLGSATFETRAAMADLAADGMIKAFAGCLPANSVNPHVWGRFVGQ